MIDCETTLRRTVQYGLEHAPELDREGQFAVLPNICGRSTAKAGICVCGCPNRKTPPVWTSCVPLSATTGSCVCGSTNSTTTNFAARRDHCRFSPQPLPRRSAGASEPVVPGRRNPAGILSRRVSGHTCLSDRRCRMSRLRFAVRVMRPLPFPDFSYSFFAVYRRSG